MTVSAQAVPHGAPCGLPATTYRLYLECNPNLCERVRRDRWGAVLGEHVRSGTGKPSPSGLEPPAQMGGRADDHMGVEVQSP